MQALSMIDTGMNTMEPVVPVQTTEPKGKPFKTVMQEQGQSEKRDLNAGQKPDGKASVQQKQAEKMGLSDGTEAQSMQAQDADVVSQESLAVTVEDDQILEAQPKLQQTLVALMKVVAGQKESSDTETQELLNQLVVQLEESDLTGEQVLAGVDLSALVEQVQQVAADDDEVSLEPLADQLALQLEQQPFTGEEIPAALAVAVDNGVAVSTETSSKVGAMAQAREILQRAINAVQSQQMNAAATTENATSETATEEVVIADDMTDDMTEGMDPRFAQLLKPRAQQAQPQQSLRQRMDVKSDSAKNVTPFESAVTDMPDADGVTSPMDSSGLKELLDGNILPKGMDRLAQVVQGSAQGSMAAAQHGAAKVVPQTPMVQLPSGHQVAESQIFDQVVTHVSGSHNGESGRMILRLQPAELGSLKLDLMVEGDRIRANLHAQTLQVQEVLERNLPQLRNALAEQGLKIDQFQVNIDQRQQGSEFDQLAQENSRDDFQQGKDHQSTQDQEEHAIPLAHLIQNGGGGLSLHV